MKLHEEFYTFAKNHYYLSLATLGLAPLIGVLGSRAIRYITNYLFPGAQAVDAVARNTLQPTPVEQTPINSGQSNISNCSKPGETLIITPVNQSDEEAAKILAKFLKRAL